VGVAAMHKEVFLYGLYFSLPGEDQTVPRAEVSSALALIEHLAHDTMVSFISDNELFVENFNAGPIFCKKVLHNDLYADIFDGLAAKNITCRVFWMPSHLLDKPDKPKKEKSKPTPDWVLREHILGNHHADRMAGIASSYFDLPIEVARPIVNYIWLTKHIQKRIIAIICSLPKRASNKRQHFSRPRPSKEELAATSMHTFEDPYDSSLEFMHCIACLSTCSLKSPKFEDFLVGNCKLNCVVNSTHRVYGQISINGTTTHNTHNLREHNGIYFCVKCGFLANLKLVRLKQLCVGPDGRTTHGNAVVRAFAAGETPVKRTRAPSSPAPRITRPRTDSSLITPQDIHAVDSVQQFIDHYRNTHPDPSIPVEISDEEVSEAFSDRSSSPHLCTWSSESD
jgi:hypothetical protein